MKILAIGLNTFREAIRDKVLYSLLFFALAVIISSLAFGALSVHEEVRLTTDLGYGGMSLFLVMIAIFIGVNLVYKELDRKTIYTLIPKPVHRYQFVLGKFTGLALTLFVLATVMSAVLVGVLMMQGTSLHDGFAMFAILIVEEVLVVTAIAVFFSSFSTPFLSGLFTIGLFLLGRSVPEIRAVADKLDQPVLTPLIRCVARIVPNLRYFFVSGGEIDGSQVSVHGHFVDWTYVALTTSYAMLYLCIVLAMAILCFSRRDFV